MVLQNPPLVSLLFLLLLPVPSLLYSLHNCTFQYTSLREVNCVGGQLFEMLSEVPNFAVILSVVGNSVTRLRQNDLSGLNKLQSLGLSNISYIEPGAFMHSLGLLRLNLYRSKLTNLTDETFRGLSNLTFLDLRDNPVKFISNSAFEHLKNLQELDLSGIGLTLSDIANKVSSCPMLQVLKLRHNNFTSFESVHFQYPLNITALDLSENPLRRFTLHTNVFPHLQSLSLSYIRTQLQWDVSDKAFLSNLKTLDLFGADFPIETYKSIFQSAESVETVTLGYVVDLLLLLDRGLLRFACAIPSLQKLGLNSNALPVLNNTLLQPCFNITDLDLSYNSLKEFSQSSLRMLTRVSWLNIACNDLVQVPLTIRNMSSLTYLSIASNTIEHLSCLDFSGLWMLTELNLGYNKLLELNSCVFQDLHRLKILDISYNSITQLDDSFSIALSNLLALNADNNVGVLQRGVFQNMSHLRELTIGQAILMDSQAFEGLRDLRFLSFSTNFVSNETSIGLASPSEGQFVYMPLLQTLIIHAIVCIELGANTFQGLGNLTTFSCTNCFCKPHSEMFRNTPLLQILEITNNDRWANPDPKLFQPIGHLKKLDLSRNHLKSLDVLSEASLTELETLILAHNELRVINVAILKTLSSLKYLDLSYNTFVCNCSNADFIQWVLGNKQVYVVKAFQYRCAYPLSEEGEFLLAFNVRSCWEFAEFISFISSFSLVFFTLLFSLIYHFLRWQIVYGYYLLQAFLYDGKQRRQGCAEVYDAFVSYSVHDEEWVYYTLVPELEERQGWRLCLHHRDFEPGKAILENITDAIYSSRKTLCVISRQYLLSEWCSREIQMASFRLFDEQKDVLVLLFLEEISSAELSPFYRMRKLVKSRTYLSWARARSHRNLFWEKVRQALESGNDPTDDHRDPLTANA